HNCDRVVRCFSPAAFAAALPGLVTERIQKTHAPGQSQDTDLHRNDNVIHDDSCPDARAESEEEHPTLAITGECVHRGIVNESHGPFEGFLKVELQPTRTEIQRLASRPP